MYFGFWFCFVFCAPLNVVYEGGGGAKEECKSRGSAGALLSGSAPFCSSVLNVLVMSDSCDPMGCSPPPSVHGVYQAAILEWVIISFSRGSSWPRDRTQVSHIAGRHFNLWATCCNPWGHKESVTTEQLKWTERCIWASFSKSSPPVEIHFKWHFNVL